MNDWRTIEPLVSLLEERDYLLDIAYGFLGSESAAEDVLRETYASWYALKGSEIWSPRYWLHNRITALCQSRLGISPVEPLDDVLGVKEDAASPDSPLRGKRGEHAPGETLLQALAEAANALTPQERISLLSDSPASGTHQTSSLPSEVIAEVARQSLRSFEAGHVSAEECQAVVSDIRTACEAGDLRVLAGLLAPDVSAVFDGGGMVRAPDLPVCGVENVTSCLATFLTPSPGMTITPQGINGEPGLVVRLNRDVVAVFSIDVYADQVINIWVFLNPDKLQRWNE